METEHTITENAYKMYFQYNEDEKDLALRLGEAFKITFGNIHGRLSFWLAQPNKQVVERFGLTQEVLVIYSSHPKTDARVMTAIENITRSPDYRHRVEKVLFLLIHYGEVEETESLLSTQTDRIIVPIRADELKNPQRGNFFVRNRISHAIGSINLFGVSSPVTSDKYFFGRDELVQQLVNQMLTKRQSMGLFGLRKTGKTSVLFAVKRRLEDRPVLSEYLDCQNPGIHTARWWQLLQNIVRRCCENLNHKQREATKIYATTVGYTVETAGLMFSSDIKALLHKDNFIQVILMLDEVEYITHGLSGALGSHWDNDFVPLWQTIRSVHQETGGMFTFMVAGVNPTCVERSHFGNIPNPIFQLATPQYLEPLTVSSVRDMVRSIGKYAGLKFEESVYTYLQGTYGGHPYLIRIACSEVWKSTNIIDPVQTTIIKIGDFNVRRQEIKQRLSQPIKDILLSLVWWYPEEYELLQILADGDAEFVKQYLESEKDSILQFAKYGILKVEVGRFAIADLQDFLKRYGEEYKKEISTFIRGDIPPELLPEVPDLETLSTMFNKRSKVEIDLRRVIFLYLGFKHAWDNTKISQAMIKGLRKRPERENPHDIFTGRLPKDVINDLFTLDLKEIILANWDIFSALFGDYKQRFEMNMDTLNVARRYDAHTKPISRDEVINFDNSFNWLRQYLDKVPQL